MTPRQLSANKIGLLASEMASRGGVQSFMLRIAEVIGDLLAQQEAAYGYCLSLNDSTESLRQHPAVPATLDVWGAARSKKKLITHAILNRPKTDVLIVGHLGLAPLAHALKILRRVRNYDVILHGIEAWKPVSPLNRRALLAARNIIATTNYTVEECGKSNHIPADRFKVIPLCADERKVTPSPIFELNGEFKLLCVARQDASERYKGFEQIFEAMAQLRLTNPDIHLNLVGTGDDQTRLKQVEEELGISDQVTFWGTLSDEELAAAYRDCDVYVMPSAREGFGIVFLEAMRHGKPCIGGNHGGTPDVIEHGKSGYLLEYGDVAALVDYMRSLADDPLVRRSLGERGAELVEDRFSFQYFRSSYQCLMR